MKKIPTLPPKRLKGNLYFGVWKWFAPSQIVGPNSDNLLAVDIASQFLLKMGFSSAKELNNTLNKFQRNHIPKALQNRLKLIFETPKIDIEDKFLFRDIEVNFEGNIFHLAYPLSQARKSKYELTIAEFGIRTIREGTVIDTRIALASNQFLKPRTSDDVAFCKLFLNGQIDLTDEIKPDEEELLSDWLSSKGAAKHHSVKAASSNEFRQNLRNAIWDRLDELAYVTISSEFAFSTEECGFTLEGEEEKGFSN